MKNISWPKITHLWATCDMTMLYKKDIVIKKDILYRKGEKHIFLNVISKNGKFLPLQLQKRIFLKFCFCKVEILCFYLCLIDTILSVRLYVHQDQGVEWRILAHTKNILLIKKLGGHSLLTVSKRDLWKLFKLLGRSTSYT